MQGTSRVGVAPCRGIQLCIYFEMSLNGPLRFPATLLSLPSPRVAYRKMKSSIFGMFFLAAAVAVSTAETTDTATPATATDSDNSNIHAAHSIVDDTAAAMTEVRVVLPLNGLP